MDKKSRPEGRPSTATRGESLSRFPRGRSFLSLRSRLAFALHEDAAFFLELAVRNRTTHCAVCPPAGLSAGVIDMSLANAHLKPPTRGTVTTRTLAGSLTSEELKL